MAERAHENYPPQLEEVRLETAPDAKDEAAHSRSEAQSFVAQLTMSRGQGVGSICAAAAAAVVLASARDAEATVAAIAAGTYVEQGTHSAPSRYLLLPRRDIGCARPERGPVRSTSEELPAVRESLRGGHRERGGVRLDSR